MGIIWNQWDDDEQFGGLLIEDVEVGPDSGILNWGHGSVGTAGYTARRVEIHNVTDGFRVSGDDIVIEDSFVKLSVREGECNHLDGVQGYGGGRNQELTARTQGQVRQHGISRSRGFRSRKPPGSSPIPSGRAG